MASVLTKKRLPIDGRIFERVLLILLFVIIAATLFDRAVNLRAQAELGIFQYNLGALRVALVLEQVSIVTGSKPALALNKNPFKLVNKQLVNYSGEMTLADAMAGALPLGAWFYDGQCACIGYRPTDNRRFESTSGNSIMIFDIQLVSGAGPSANGSVATLTAREPYRWRDEVIH